MTKVSNNTYPNPFFNIRHVLTVLAGLIHRDIKPDNMFILPSGVLKIGKGSDVMMMIVTLL